MTDFKTPWLDPACAPKDGTMCRLLVEFEENSTEDKDWAATIGFNPQENTGDHHWDIAGWNWEQDRFTEGKGKVIGWLPMLYVPEGYAVVPIQPTQAMIDERKIFGQFSEQRARMIWASMLSAALAVQG